MGRPRLGVMIGAGNLDSMVAHYTASRHPRREDFYSPGRKTGLRPDRAVTVYANRAREAFPGLPLVIGSLEASLRRFAHYDYCRTRCAAASFSTPGPTSSSTAWASTRRLRLPAASPPART